MRVLDEKTFKKIKRQLKKDEVKLVAEAHQLSESTVRRIRQAATFIDYKFNSRLNHSKTKDWLIDRGYEELPGRSTWFHRLAEKLKKK